MNQLNIRLAACQAREWEAWRLVQEADSNVKPGSLMDRMLSRIDDALQSDHAALDAYVEEQTANLRTALRRAQKEASEAEAEAHVLRSALSDADPENSALEETRLRSAALDAALGAAEERGREEEAKVRNTCQQCWAEASNPDSSGGPLRPAEIRLCKEHYDAILEQARQEAYIGSADNVKATVHAV